MSVVRSEIEINAPIQLVWDIIVDLLKYPEWNPFTVDARSSLKPGEPIDLQVALRPGRLHMQREFIGVVEPPTKISWRLKMGPHWLMRAERTQVLEALSESRTRYTNEDVLGGLLEPLVMKLYGKAMQRGFDGVARALKTRAEDAYKAQRAA